MAVLRLIVDIIARADPGLWYLVDLRRRFRLSWVPVIFLVVLLVFAAVECLIVGNTGGGLMLSALGFGLLIVKLRASAHA